MKKELLKITMAVLFIGIMINSAYAVDLSVKDFGAKGDGKNDDRAAIQSAVDAINKAGGGTINFPEGIYIISAPNKGKWEPQIKLCNNLKFVGAGMYKTVLKIADNQGAYDAIFTGDSISGFAMLDMTFDANGETNQMLNPNDAFASPWLHTPVYLPNARNISIERVRFTNLSGIWAIYALGGAENVLIDKCIFDNIGGFTKKDWDHSTIRIDVGGDGPVVVSNNIMTSRYGSGTTGARTAMEIHGSNQKVINNKIHGFRYGINVCTGRGMGSTKGVTVNQEYINNTVSGVGSAFVFWSMTTQGFDGVLFENNKVEIDVQGWKNKFGGENRGMFQTSSSRGPIKNLVVKHNEVSYLGSEGYGNSSDLHAGMWIGALPGSKTNTQISNLTIIDNIIQNSTSAGIALKTNIEGAEITGNKIINPGRATSALNEKYAAGIYMEGTMKNISITKNTFVDDQAINTMKTIIWDESSNQGGCSVSKNKVKIKSKSTVPAFHSNAAQTGTPWSVAK